MGSRWCGFIVRATYPHEQSQWLCLNFGDPVHLSQSAWKCTFPPEALLPWQPGYLHSLSSQRLDPCDITQLCNEVINSSTDTVTVVSHMYCGDVFVYMNERESDNCYGTDSVFSQWYFTIFWSSSLLLPSRVVRSTGSVSSLSGPASATGGLLFSEAK